MRSQAAFISNLLEGVNLTKMTQSARAEILPLLVLRTLKVSFEK